MKILVSAYACEPGKGSEPGIGWKWINQVARYNDVWVLTRHTNRSIIEAEADNILLRKVNWVYVDLPAWSRFWKKGQRGVRTYYMMWQLVAWLKARQLHLEYKFDLVHHVTFGTYWLPALVCLLPIPFVWGPVGGGESTPPLLKRSLYTRDWVYENARDLLRLFCEYNPFLRLTIKRAVLALATTQETADRLIKLKADTVKVLSHVALDASDLHYLNDVRQRSGEPFRLISMGRLLHWKGFHIGLKAFARLVTEFPESEYWIIGDGPERHRLMTLADQIGIFDKVVFWGTLSRSDTFVKLADSDVLIHPSFHDSGGYVCVEASAAGKPVICMDVGGPALQVTSDTGIKVTARDSVRLVDDFAAAMRILAGSPELRWEMGHAARLHVNKHFLWDTKGNYIQEVYKQIILEKSLSEIN
jgi:glycosyltransferase involved in cell wall biosynthesis